MTASLCIFCEYFIPGSQLSSGIVTLHSCNKKMIQNPQLKYSQENRCTDFSLKNELTEDKKLKKKRSRPSTIRRLRE